MAILKKSLLPAASIPAGPDSEDSSNYGRDPLTGFYDQSYLNHRLHRCIEQPERSRIPVSLALLQLENFYETRRWLGKSETTLLLSDIAKMLKKSLPDSVELCRCQHYEFAVLLVGEASREAVKITNHIRQLVETTAAKALPGRFSLRVGVGVAELDSHTVSIDVIYARARHDMMRLQHSKIAGFLDNNQFSHEALFARIQYCLRNKKLTANYQAVVNLKTDDVEHYEIRVGVKDQQGRIPSELFFEIAVQNAWGESIDRWLVNKAIKLLKRNEKLKLTISLTHNSVVSTEFFSWLNMLRTQHHGLLSRLVIQISEIDVLIAQHHLGYVCHQLNKLDISLCINHFGCTDDPFRYLNLLRADFVKLDQSLLEKYKLNDSQSASLPDLVEKLHENGLRVVTGKIDNMAVLPKLWKSNVNFVQGYCFHQPSSQLDFEFTQEETLTLH